MKLASHQKYKCTIFLKKMTVKCLITLVRSQVDKQCKITKSFKNICLLDYFWYFCVISNTFLITTYIFTKTLVKRVSPTANLAIIIFFTTTYLGL